MRAGNASFPLSVYISAYFSALACSVISTAVATMPKDLVTLSLLWSFVLLLAPGPAHGDFNSGDCTIDDSPGKEFYGIVPYVNY